MAKKVGEIRASHPTTGQEVVLRFVDDGNYVLDIVGTKGKPQRWAMANNFTGGDGGTRMRIVEVP